MAIKIDKLSIYFEAEIRNNIDKIFSRKIIKNFSQEENESETIYLNLPEIQINYSHQNIFLNYSPDIFSKIFDTNLISQQLQIIKTLYLKKNFSFSDNDYYSAKISRLDLCHNSENINFHDIESILKNQNISRMKTNYYPSSLLFFNKSIEFIFYDKPLEQNEKLNHIEKKINELKKKKEYKLQSEILENSIVISRIYYNNIYEYLEQNKTKKILRTEIRFKTNQKIEYYFLIEKKNKK